MRRYPSGVLMAMVAAATVSLAAQGRSPSPVGSPPGDSNARPGTQQTAPAPGAQGRIPNTTVISGCLRREPVVTAGITARAPEPPVYMLANGVITAEGKPTETAGATPGAAARYRLEGEEKTLAPHVNHQVRIKGSLQTTTRADGSAGTSILKVDSVDMIAEACPAPAAQGR